MQPVIQDIAVYQGDRFDLFFRFRQKVWNPATEEYEPGPYIDLTDKTIRAELRTVVADDPGSVLLASFVITKSDQGTVTGGCTISLLPVTTTALLVNGVYDVEIETTANPVDRKTIIRGAMILTQQVTKVA